MTEYKRGFDFAEDKLKSGVYTLEDLSNLVEEAYEFGTNTDFDDGIKAAIAVRRHRDGRLQSVGKEKSVDIQRS